jgi:hypothetical protein
MPRRLSAAVLAGGLVVTGLLAAGSRVNFVDTEHRLTVLQAKLTGAALESAPVDFERRLGRAVSAVAASGDTGLFRHYMTPSVGKAAPFVDAELFAIRGSSVHLLALVGRPPTLPPGSAAMASMARRAAAGGTLYVGRLAHATATGAQRLSLALSAAGPSGTYVAYAEVVLPADRRVAVPKRNADSDLYVAIYFGRHTSRAALIETDARHLPMSGQTATTHVRLGDAVLTLVVSPRGALTGTLAQLLPLGIAALGVVLTLVVAGMAESITRRRIAAEGLAAENRRLFQAQLGVSERLQHSLLPQRLPLDPDLEIVARYRGGTTGIDVGGDWYDVVRVDERTVFFTVGDVVGRGLDAAILMSSLRNAIDAYATDRIPPEEVLAKLARLVDVGRDGRFATVVCGTIDTRTGETWVANAGHPPPLIVHGDRCELVHTAVGPPVGVGDGHRYRSVPVMLPAGSTLLAYTDGLVERRGEPLSAGLERLCHAARGGVPLDELVDGVIVALVPGEPDDDIATLAIRWRGSAAGATSPASGAAEQPGSPAGAPGAPTPAAASAVGSSASAGYAAAPSAAGDRSGAEAGS